MFQENTAWLETLKALQNSGQAPWDRSPPGTSRTGAVRERPGRLLPPILGLRQLPAGRTGAPLRPVPLGLPCPAGSGGEPGGEPACGPRTLPPLARRHGGPGGFPGLAGLPEDLRGAGRGRCPALRREEPGGVRGRLRGSPGQERGELHPLLLPRARFPTPGNDYDMADYYYKTALQLGSDPATTDFALGLNAYAVNRLEDAKAFLAKAKAAPRRTATPRGWTRSWAAWARPSHAGR
ncbi:MAG: hypothetical protein M0C28_41520 [Candidatus Moduliflexus flocculans]|nr:hypothetical protein [Candidatus Moduliflexus flocculans]